MTHLRHCIDTFPLRIRSRREPTITRRASFHCAAPPQKRTGLAQGFDAMATAAYADRHIREVGVYIKVRLHIPDSRIKPD